MAPPLKRLWRALLGLVFQERCAGCRAWGGAVLCAACEAAWPALSGPACPRCALPEVPCGACGGQPPPFERTVAAGVYTGVLRQAIHAMKYRGHRAAADMLAERVVASSGFPDGEWLVVPVPLTTQKHRERGYNQAALLGRAIARQKRWPFEDALTRAVETTPQHALNREARRANMAGAFAVGRSVAGRRVLLVDDVLTTGATVEACSRVLLNAGATAVAIAVVGRTLAPGHHHDRTN